MLEYVAAPPGASYPSFPSVGESEPPGSPGVFFPDSAEFVLQDWPDQPLPLWAALLLREEGKWTPCPVKKALRDPSSAVRLRWKYGHKALALAGSFMAEENSDPGKIPLGSALGV